MARKASAKQNDADASSILSLSGLVERLFVALPSFSAGKLLSEKHLSPVSFTAKQQLAEGQQIILHGEWIHHEKYGPQFEAQRVEHCVELDTRGLALWLEKNGEARGIGKSKAKRIAEEFGKKFDSVITSEPERVQTFAKLSDEQLQSLIATWQEHRADAKLITWLASFELSINEIEKIREKYGNGAYAVLSKDPYAIIREIERFGFKKVDKIALKMGTRKDHSSRIRHGVLWVVREALEQGDTYVERADLLRKSEVLLELDRPDAREMIEEAIEKSLSNNKLYQPINTSIIVDSGIAKMERIVFMKLAENAKAKNRVFDDWMDQDKGENGIRSVAPELNHLQFKSVQQALTSQLSLISGGAGTGKTFTVNTIRLAYESLDKTVGLCAPTGKAARRLEETTGHKSHTIHRLLGFNPKLGWEYNADKPLPYDCVIVDETSMVDSILAYRLFSAIDFTRTSLVLVGDHNQLPPVGPGNLLRDLINSHIIPTTILTEVVRQAGALKANCSAILQGNLASTVDADESGFTPWQVLKGGLDDPIVCRNYILSAFEQMLVHYRRTDLINGIQLLIPMKDRDLGTRRLNIEIQRLVQRKQYQTEVEPLPSEKSRPKFYKFDKVIQTKNDYDLDVMNGTIGFVDNVQPNGDIYVAFDGKQGIVKISGDKKNNIDLAYALTIHKAQGSEFPMVFLVAHRAHSFMANRSLLYTGATRAKQKLIIIGDSWGIRNYLTTQVVDKRKTYLSKLLKTEAN